MFFVVCAAIKSRYKDIFLVSFSPLSDNQGKSDVDDQWKVMGLCSGVMHASDYMKHCQASSSRLFSYFNACRKCLENHFVLFLFFLLSFFRSSKEQRKKWENLRRFRNLQQIQNEAIACLRKFFEIHGEHCESLTRPSCPRRILLQVISIYIENNLWEHGFRMRERRLCSESQSIFQKNVTTNLRSHLNCKALNC